MEEGQEAGVVVDGGRCGEVGWGKLVAGSWLGWRELP